mmetsp:Transcript_19200/g.39495  ORF Transcript_19200/g.39495 Transcript_19200/m.39495 type:complete len:213 (+) Transcript_19200:69-707(+)|eukprot:CAMPEP_0197275088 /NCGR_PEP_ID=MMETSP1432-20130617/13488_1 /TAXON_ID=44447 /ORGANISM="Pseudo-nitzschia delicatissima, Strain UNC1205" /LENGTH=212 /DNA_ID=CAMNT_0042740957 /DNA_START=64 /DNA_END=702 /DNA_ORIENTATION=+
MNRSIARATVLTLLFAQASAFAPLRPMSRSATIVFDTVAESTIDPAAEIPASNDESTGPATPPPVPKKKPVKMEKDADGLFAPAVIVAKEIIGVKELNKLRGKIISLHSDVIGKFTETAQSEFGNQVLKVLFTLADKNGDGTIDEEELAIALNALGFDFLKDKQIAGIFKRADGDDNGNLDFEEFEQAAPKTLKNALVKLAKKNGHDLGFLA